MTDEAATANGPVMDEIPDDPLELVEAVEEIPAPLGTGPHEVRELDSWLPWAVYECRRCGQKAWFHTRGYERFACNGEPEPDAEGRSTRRDAVGDEGR